MRHINSYFDCNFVKLIYYSFFIRQARVSHGAYSVFLMCLYELVLGALGSVTYGVLTTAKCCNVWTCLTTSLRHLQGFELLDI